MQNVYEPSDIATQFFRVIIYAPTTFVNDDEEFKSLKAVFHLSYFKIEESRTYTVFPMTLVSRSIFFIPIFLIVQY